MTDLRTPSEMAQAVLDALGAAADAAGVTVERRVVAAGPAFARDCRMLAVHVDGFTDVPLPGGCGHVTGVAVMAHFIDNCVPVLQGRAPQTQAPPPAQDITDHAVEFLDDVWAVNAGLRAWVAGLEDPLAPPTISATSFTGPGGRAVEARWTVTMRLSGLPADPS